MKKIIQYCCFVFLLLFSINTKAQTTNSGLLSIATNTQWDITGDFNNNNQELAIEIGSASENNLLIASGNIILNGKLIVNLANGFVPASNQAFTIITASGVSGTFGSIVFPSNYLADITYNATTVVLSNFRSSALPITGNFVACSFGAGNKLSIATTGGTWASSNTNVATINSSGIVTALSNGISTISYTYNANGTTNVSATTFTVAVVPALPAISGAGSLCVGASTTLSIAAAGGAWSSIAGRATINTGGVVTGVSAGTATLRYTITNGNACSAFATHNITISSVGATPSIAYAPGTVNPQTTSVGGLVTFCKNRTFTVTGNPSGGSWSSTGVLTISNAGVINTGNVVGGGSITYTSAGGCGGSRTINANVATCAARGIAGNQLSAFSNEWTIYPNPASKIVNLKIDRLAGNSTIIITDLLGKEVMQQKINNLVSSINIEALGKGIYFVSVITDEGKTTRKLIVE